MKNAMTLTELQQSLRVFGATDIEIIQKRPDVEIKTEGLDAEARHQAVRAIQKGTPAGTQVVIDNYTAGTPEPPESSTGAIAMMNVSTLFDGSETAQRAAQNDTDSVEKVKHRYVRGDIEHVYGLEEALSEPVEQQLESEGLL